MFLYRCVEALHHHLPVPPSTPPTLHTSFSLPLQLNDCVGGGIGDTVSLTSLPPLCTTPSTTSPNGDVLCFRIPPVVYEWDVIKDEFWSSKFGNNAANHHVQKPSNNLDVQCFERLLLKQVTPLQPPDLGLAEWCRLHEISPLALLLFVEAWVSRMNLECKDLETMLPSTSRFQKLNNI
ncbi:hypothetical protein DAPPUDRAFT_249235 [Daphnia pulex]|uniref:Uncharacterized protein n=1 Tax=Daphnia pulex TaxID=6669 RepID=E9GW78_DAPPU|nr:hypothetical protein DAPPUDRAFT_249235 [Daphnia pulex]|eukprot:EFX76300.1 hypothetical protein DAPPUDRAFT_249235 [Daphnia pulex]